MFEHISAGADTVGRVALSMMSISSDTLQTNAAVAAFFLAMALYPEVQMQAQKELEAVVGTNRLPKFSDRASLPYMTPSSRNYCAGMSSCPSECHIVSWPTMSTVAISYPAALQSS